jgi:hypothetical protein
VQKTLFSFFSFALMKLYCCSQSLLNLHRYFALAFLDFGLPGLEQKLSALRFDAMLAK